MTEKEELLQKNRSKFDSRMLDNFKRDQHLYNLSERFLVLSALGGLFSYRTGVVFKTFSNHTATIAQYYEVAALSLLFIAFTYMMKTILDGVTDLARYIVESALIKFGVKSYTNSAWGWVAFAITVTTLASPIIFFLGQWSHELGTLGYNSK